MRQYDLGLRVRFTQRTPGARRSDLSLLTAVAVLGYRYGTSELMIYASLFALGALIYGPQLLIGVSVISFAPKQATTVTNGWSVRSVTCSVIQSQKSV